MPRFCLCTHASRDLICLGTHAVVVLDLSKRGSGRAAAAVLRPVAGRAPLRQVALVHTEYPGGVYNLSGPSPPECAGLAPDGSGKAKNYPYCWTVTIGLAVSHDFGTTWQHARPPPHHLVAAVPYKYTANQLAYGWGDPSNIMKHPKDGGRPGCMLTRVT